MDEKIKLPGSSFDEVSKIIQAYAAANRPVSLDDVSKRIGMHTTIVSRNNGFLISIGILEGGKNKAITSPGKKLGDALSHGLEDEVKQLLQGIVEGNEFLKNLVGAVRIRKGMEESALRAHVAYSAGQAKSQGVMTGTGTVVEMLKRAGVLEERDGKLEAVVQPTSRSDAPAERSQDNFPPRTSSTFHGRAVRTEMLHGSTSLVIEVRVNCTPNELEGLGTKLKAMLAELESKDGEDIPNTEDED